MEDIEKIKNMTYQEFINYIRKHPKGVYVKDGIYDVSDIESFLVDFKGKEASAAWIDAHDKFWRASAYETETFFLFSEEPRRFGGEWDGSGFNYGSTNVIRNCPRDILILAEND